MNEQELAQLRERWAKDETRWHFVLSTFWQLDYEQIVLVLSRVKTLDDAVLMAERERDGMIAT